MQPRKFGLRKIYSRILGRTSLLIHLYLKQIYMKQKEGRGDPILSHNTPRKKLWSSERIFKVLWKMIQTVHYKRRKCDPMYNTHSDVCWVPKFLSDSGRVKANKQGAQHFFFSWNWIILGSSFVIAFGWFGRTYKNLSKHWWKIINFGDKFCPE